ncbi:MAG: glycosyltransferase, partial [Rhizobiales bacterium]|nr:glycosyltransferase [Hyphomicrobiales bacterium]
VLLFDKRDLLGIEPDDPLPAVHARTAMLLPTYNEDTRRVMARLRAIHRSVRETGYGSQFDWFVLSDTTDPRIWIEEEQELLRLRHEGLTNLYYRHRERNTARKSGNIEDWVRRFGGGYDDMIVLDADSLMTGDTIVRLVDAMERHDDVAGPDLAAHGAVLDVHAGERARGGAAVEGGCAHRRRRDDRHVVDRHELGLPPDVDPSHLGARAREGERDRSCLTERLHGDRAGDGDRPGGRIGDARTDHLDEEGARLAARERDRLTVARGGAVDARILQAAHGAGATSGRIDEHDVEIDAAAPGRGHDNVTEGALGALRLELRDRRGDRGALRVFQTGEPALGRACPPLRAFARDRTGERVGVGAAELGGRDVERAALRLAEAIVGAAHRLRDGKGVRGRERARGERPAEDPKRRVPIAAPRRHVRAPDDDVDVERIPRGPLLERLRELVELPRQSGHARELLVLGALVRCSRNGGAGLRDLVRSNGGRRVRRDGRAAHEYLLHEASGPASSKSVAVERVGGRSVEAALA